jgi:DNA-binding transcriptional LysR family regulator
VSPTPAGREFLRIINRILQEIDDVANGVRSTVRGEMGWLTSLASGEFALNRRFSHLAHAVLID